MEQLVQALKDYILNLSLNSKRAGATPSPSLPSAKKDHDDDDSIHLDLDLERDFHALQTKSPAQHTDQKLKSVLDDELSARFAALKADSPVSPTATASNGHDNLNRMWIFSCASKEAADSAVKFKAITDSVLKGEDNAKSSVSWKAPPSGSYKVNVDGSTCNTTQESGFGGLVRDSSGKWLIGFTAHIGKSEILFAELLGILHGIRIAKTLGITSLTCESDSKEAVTLANLDPHLAKDHKYGPLIHDIKQLLSSPNWKVAVVHILREANSSADFLAKLGRHGGDILTVRNEPPKGLWPHLLADRTGVRPPEFRMHRDKSNKCTCVNIIHRDLNCPVHRPKGNKCTCLNTSQFSEGNPFWPIHRHEGEGRKIYNLSQLSRR